MTPPALSVDTLVPKIGKLLGAQVLCVRQHANSIAWIHVGRPGTGEHRSVTPDEWERLILGGVPLLPWAWAQRLSWSLALRMRGSA